MASLRGSNNVALGYDEGSIIVKVIINSNISLNGWTQGKQFALCFSTVIFQVTSLVNLALLLLSIRDEALEI